jgi:hypothetical protein
MEFPWKQLKKFEGERVPLEDGRYILGSGENLVECILSLVEDGTELGDLHSLSHSHLQSLTLRGVDFHSDPAIKYPPILSLLTLPTLRNLELHIGELDLEQISFISRHSTQPRTFSSSKTIPIDSLRDMPRLTDLKLVLWDRQVSYLHDFCRELEDPENLFLPQIQHISFLHCDFMLDSADVKILARSLSSRWEPGNRQVAQIRSFRLQVIPPRNPTEMAKDFQKIIPLLAFLNALAMKGMRVYVGTKSTNYIQPSLRW